MKRTLLVISLLLCAISFVRPWEGDCTTHAWYGGTKEMAYSFASFLPTFSTDFSDLDRRDAQNRPVQTPSTTDDLITLFAQNLFSLVAVLPTHEARQAALVVETNSHLFNKLFLEASIWLWSVAMEVAFASKKRFVHNVNNLWITISVGVFAEFSLTALRPSPQSSFAIPLRC